MVFPGANRYKNDGPASKGKGCEKYLGEWLLILRTQAIKVLVIFVREPAWLSCAGLGRRLGSVFEGEAEAGQSRAG